MISFVIPAFNERDAVEDTIARARRTLEQSNLDPFEIIVVDDGSSDGTGQCAESTGVKVIRHPHNVGYGRSLKDGILAAKYDIIVISDADGSYPIETVPELIKMYQGGFDMVVGERTGEAYRESALKSPLRLILKTIAQFTAGREIPDVNSGLRVFSKTTALPYFEHLSNRFSFKIRGRSKAAVHDQD